MYKLKITVTIGNVGKGQRLYQWMELTSWRPSWPTASWGPCLRWTCERSAWYEPWCDQMSKIFRDFVKGLDLRLDLIKSNNREQWYRWKNRTLRKPNRTVRQGCQTKKIISNKFGQNKELKNKKWQTEKNKPKGFQAFNLLTFLKWITYNWFQNIRIFVIIKALKRS